MPLSNSFITISRIDSSKSIIYDAQVEQSDTELTLLIKTSDTGAFKILYYRYYEHLFRFLVYKTRNYELAKDLVQDIFYKIWNNRDSLNEGKSIKAYLFRSANNLAIDHLRKITTEVAYIQNAEQNQILMPNEQFDLQEKAHEAIKSLPEPLQTVFCLNRFDGLKYKEIAETLDISIKTVESRMSKALKILRVELKSFLALLLF